MNKVEITPLLRPFRMLAAMQLFRSFFAVVFVFLLASSSVAQGEPSAKEILQRWDDALAPPVRYRVRVGRRETTVSKKMLPGGVLATRTEPVEGSQTIMLSLGDKYYEILPQSRVVIDKNSLMSGDKPLSQDIRGRNELSLRFTPAAPDDAKIVDEQVAPLTRDGREFYKVTLGFSSPLQEGIGKLPFAPEILTRGVQAGQSLIVDKESLTPVELETLSTTGDVLTKFEYLDVDQSAPLADDLFQLPADYAVKTPKTRTEYYNFHKKYWNDIRPRPTAPPAYLASAEVLERTEKMLAKFREDIQLVKDPATGITHLKGQTVEEAVKMSAAAREEMTDSVSRRTGLFKVFLIANIAVIAIVLFLLVRRRQRGQSA